MLLQLEIKNFAIIEYSLINFEKGFSVITGETGAGKSILLEALSSVLGERTRKDLVRKGTEKAELKAVLTKTKKIEEALRSKEIFIEEDYIILERHILKNGRSLFKLNGRIETMNAIRDIQNYLVEICSQRDHLSLLKENYFLHLIDDLGSEKHSQNIKTYKDVFYKWNEKKEELENLMSVERKQEQLLDLYRFQKKEIEQAKLTENEEEELTKDEKILSSFDKLSKLMGESLQGLEKTDDIFDSFSALQEASVLNDDLVELADRLQRVYYELDDIRSETRRYRDSLEYDEERLNEVIVRLQLIKNLKRKYGDSVQEIMRYYEEVKNNLGDIENKEEKIESLQIEISRLEKELENLSKVIHKERTKVAQKYELLINEKIHELCMPDAYFHFNIEELENYTSVGNTRINVMFNANKGEDLKLLSKVASGGELSRVLLALKLALNITDLEHTLIFDEVDEGIGGEVGRIIGEKLKNLGLANQVIVISHLPQVAAKATNHFLIQKKTTEERTVSTLTKLKQEDRMFEIARMINGDKITETTLKQAEEMLNE